MYAILKLPRASHPVPQPEPSLGHVGGAYSVSRAPAAFYDSSAIFFYDMRKTYPRKLSLFSKQQILVKLLG